MKQKIISRLQRLGQILMTPISILPIAGLLLTLGLYLDIGYLNAAGQIVFDNLPVIFAVAIAAVLAEDHYGSLAALLMFLVFNVVISEFITSAPTESIDAIHHTSILGIETLDTGVFGGLVVGLLASLIFKHFKKYNLPEVLAFFSGRRFGIMMAMLLAIPLGHFFPYIWIPIQQTIIGFSRVAIQTNEAFASLIYGLVERALVPFGLQHIWNVPFYYNFGEYMNSAGQMIYGDIPVFFAQLADGATITAGAFTTGRFPVMIFGLPAAGFAMYKSSFKNQREDTKAIILASSLVCMFAGITEPLEFMFLFVAPILYVFHIVLSGTSFFLMSILNVKIGHPFSGGIIDYLLYGVVPNKTQWWIVIIVGIIYAIIYYFVFRFSIERWNLMTPGRVVKESKVEMKDVAPLLNSRNSRQKQINNILGSIGGIENIQFVDACMSRLRLTLIDKNMLSIDKLAESGYTEIMNFEDGNIQIIVGAIAPLLSDSIQSELYKSKIREEK